jgi:hypothetical protein
MRAHTTSHAAQRRRHQVAAAPRYVSAYLRTHAPHAPHALKEAVAWRAAAPLHGSAYLRTHDTHALKEAHAAGGALRRGTLVPI